MFPWTSKPSDSNCALGYRNRQHNSCRPSHSLQYPHQACLGGGKKGGFEERAWWSSLICPLHYTYCQLSQDMFRHMGAIKNPTNTWYNALQFEHGYEITILSKHGSKIKPFLWMSFNMKTCMCISVIKRQGNSFKLLRQEKSFMPQGPFVYGYIFLGKQGSLSACKFPA